MKKLMKDIFWKLMFDIFKGYMNFTTIQKRIKIEKVKKLEAYFDDKTEYVTETRNLNKH